MSFKTTAEGVMIWIPETEPPRFKCTVIVGHEGTENVYCNTPFWRESEWLNHTTKCAREHEAEIMQAAPSQRLPGFYGPDAGIPDVERWLGEQDAAGESNRRKVIQGRKKL